MLFVFMLRLCHQQILTDFDKRWRAMHITNLDSNELIIKELGKRIRDNRVAMNIKQSELADMAGVSLRTISNIENGGDVKLSVFINILRGINQADKLNIIIDDQSIRPSNYLDVGKKRVRAGKSKVSEKRNWVWGEDK